jgi:hypothetical protein
VPDRVRDYAVAEGSGSEGELLVRHIHGPALKRPSMRSPGRPIYERAHVLLTEGLSNFRHSFYGRARAAEAERCPFVRGL